MTFTAAASPPDDSLTDLAALGRIAAGWASIGPPRRKGMLGVVFHVRDIAADRFADAQLQALHQIVACAEQLVWCLAAMAQGLIEIFPGGGMGADMSLEVQ